MIPVLTIQLFGNFQLTFAGEPLVHIKSAPMQSLLAYLLIRRNRPQARQHLAYLLWPDSTEAQAYTNLRRELHLLRRALPSAERFLRIDAKFLQWRADADFTLDVGDFETAAAEVDQLKGNQLTDDQLKGDENMDSLRAMLEKVVALYTGDLLLGCYDDWIVSERERLSQVFAGMLEQLIQLCERQRDYSLAIRYAERLRRYDPLHEATYRHLMRLHTLNGERARGLRIFHTCVTTLKRELDVDPSPATRETYARLIEGARSSTSLPEPQARLEVGGRLVGRQVEWDRLQAAWHKTAPTGQPAQPHLALITGDAGIGKTRLVEELLDWASQQGIVTARTRCYAAEGALALAPVADWLRADAFRSALLALDEIWLAEVARLLPELLVERPELPRPALLTGSGQRLRLFEALAQVVLADRQPLLMVIDDLQWCDRETLEWLHFLVRGSQGRPLLLVFTARAEVLDADHPLRSLLLDLRGLEQMSEIEVGPLSPEATARLAAQMLGRDLDLEVASHLYAETEGHPLLIVEMVRAQWAPGLARDHQLPPSTSGHTSAPKARIEHPRASLHALPPKVHAIIQSRLAQLSPQARELAALAATIGRSFTYQVLAQADDSDEASLVGALDELWQRRIIREQEIDAYDFSHDKIREVAYGEISRARRQLLHRRVAQALEIVYEQEQDTVSGHIAAHYERAGLSQPAILHYQRAAKLARHIYANQEAKTLYSRAIAASHRITTAPLSDAAAAIGEAGSTKDDALLLPIYEGRALVCQSLTQFDEAIADFHEMRRMARATGNHQKESESLCHLAYAHWLTFAEDQMPLVEQYAQAAMELFAQTGDQAIRARSLTMLGAVDQVNRKLVDADQKLKEALEICRRVGDKEALVQSLSFLCLQTYLHGNSQSTVQFAQEGVKVARAIQDGFNELRIHAFLCQGQWSAGNFAHAFTQVHTAMVQAEARGNLFIQGRLLNTLGWFHHELGDFANAVDYNQRSVELGRASGIDNVEISALINLGYDSLAQGESTRALAYFASTLTRVEREGFGAHKWRWQMKLFFGLAEHALRTGDDGQALHFVKQGLDEALVTSSQKYAAKGLALHGRILMQMGQHEAAGAEFQRAVALAEPLHCPSLSYPLAYALGQWHESRGHMREAAALFAKAKAVVEQMATAVGDDDLAALFLRSESVRMISESWARTV